MLYRLPALDLEAQICGPTSLCPLPHRDYASWNLSVNLYTVNAPWLFSLLWCAGVPSVTSDNAHTLSQVPSPLWIMVSWRSRELSVAHKMGQAPHLGLSGEVSGWGGCMGLQA